MSSETRTDNPAETIASRRIERFRSESAADAASALVRLTAELREAGGPLIEHVEDSESVLVTFVYVGSAADVRVSCQLFEPTEPLLGEPMSRVEGTDVWHLSVEADPRIETTYQFQVDPPDLGGGDPEELLAILADPERLTVLLRELFLASHPDPVNPRRQYALLGINGGDPEGTAGPEHDESILVLPAAESFLHEDHENPGPLRGRLEHHDFDAAALPGQRTVSVYLPPGYDAKADYPLLVALDGEMLLRCAGIDRVLDAAIAAGDLPPIVVAFWHNLTIASRMVEMACNPALGEALADELVPYLAERYAVTAGPDQTIIAGMSYGGLAAAFLALERSDAFGAALAMSPSLWFAPPPPSEGEPAEEPEWLVRRYAAEKPVPARLFITVGTLEDRPIAFAGMGDRTQVSVARRFREVLKDKGYDVAGYVEQPAGHELVQVQRVIIPGLAALLS